VTVAKPFPVFDPVAEFTALLRDQLVADGIIEGERVAYGAALAFRQEDAPRVYVDLDENFTVVRPGSGASNNGFGLKSQMQDDDDVTVDVEARSLWTCLDGMNIHLLGQIPESGEESADLRGDEPATLARLSVFQLRARVLKALYHILKLGASSIRGRFIRPEEDEFQYGSACTLFISIASEVPDEQVVIAKPPGEATMIAEYPTGDETLVATLYLDQPQ
jgi:hypothetical protein